MIAKVSTAAQFYIPELREKLKPLVDNLSPIRRPSARRRLNAWVAKVRLPR